MRRTRPAICALLVLQLGLLPWRSQALRGSRRKPRAVAIAVTGAGAPPEARTALARAALSALDRLKTVRTVKAAALREALVPRIDEPAPWAQALALAASAALIGAKDAASASAVYAKALSIVFEQLSAARARRWVTRFGRKAAAALRLASPGGSPLQRRLQRWRAPPAPGAGAAVTLSLAPAAARVFVDGRPAGKGPEVVLRASPEAHDVRVELDGHEPVHRVVDFAKSKGLTLKLGPVDPTADLRALLSQLQAAFGAAKSLGPILSRFAERLDVSLVFLVTPEEGGSLVRLFDADRGNFAGASPTQSSDASTLRRAFRALLDLRGSSLPGTGRLARRRRRRSKGGKTPIWKKWWVWALILGGAGAVTGGVLLSRQGEADGTLTLRVRR